MSLGFDPYQYYGNPDELDSIAIRLSRLAQKVGDASHAIDRQVKSMRFEGPKAREIRERSLDGRRMAQDVVAGMQELSHAMFQSASFSHEKIHDLDLAEERIRRGLHPPGT